MALSTEELYELKYELGYHNLTIDSLPMIGYYPLFDQIVNVYLAPEISTTTSTATVAAQVVTPVSLTVASATGFAVGNRVVIDVDDLEEIATIRSIVGNVMTLAIKGAHSGSYPIVEFGPIARVRSLLRSIRAVKAKIANLMGTGAVKKVDEVEFYQSGNKTILQLLQDQLAFWRHELSSVVGIPDLWLAHGSGGGSYSLSVY